jgi:hypothetical protein
VDSISDGIMTGFGNRIMFGVALAALVTGPAGLAGQVSSSAQRPMFWGTLALGAAGAADSGFYHSSLGAAVQLRRLIIIGRVTGNDTPDAKRIEDAGILVGAATRPFAPFHFSVAAGLSALNDHYWDRSTVGFPVEAQGTWRFARWTGIGVRVFAVPNEINTYAGISLALQVGRLR